LKKKYFIVLFYSSIVYISIVYSLIIVAQKNSDKIKEIRKFFENKKKIEIRQFETYDSFFEEILQNSFLPGLFRNPEIKYLLINLKMFDKIIFNNNYISGNFSMTKSNKSDTSYSLGFQGSNLINLFRQIFFTYRESVLRILEKVHELLSIFFDQYINLVSLESQRELKEYFINIHEFYVEKMELLSKSGRVNKTDLEMEKFGLLMEKIELKKIENNIKSLKSQIQGNSFILENPKLFIFGNVFGNVFENVFENIFENIFLDKIPIMNKFLKSIGLCSVNDHGVFTIKMKNLESLKNFREFNYFPISADVSAQKSFKKSSMLSGSISFSFNNAIQYMIAWKNSIDKILKQIQEESEIFYQNSIDSLRDSKAIIQFLLENYNNNLENFSKQTFKFKILGNIISIINFIRQYMVVILEKYYESNIQLCKKNIEIALETLAILITIRILDRKEYKEFCKSNKKIKNISKNPFKEEV